MQESCQFNRGDTVIYNDSLLTIEEIYDTFCVVLDTHGRFFTISYDTLSGLEYEDVAFNITP